MSRAPSARNAVVLCVGKKGSGKTTWLRTAVRYSRRMLVLDPEATWRPTARDRVVTNAGELADALPSPVPVRDRGFRIVYRDDAALLAEWGFHAAYVWQRCTLVVDELAWFCTPQRIPLWLQRILQFGRQREVNVIGTTREPQEVHDLLFSQADYIRWFRVDPGNGLERIRRRYGKELAGRLPELRMGKQNQTLEWGDPSVLELLRREGQNFRRG